MSCDNSCYRASNYTPYKCLALDALCLLSQTADGFSFAPLSEDVVRSAHIECASVLAPQGPMLPMILPGCHASLHLHVRLRKEETNEKRRRGGSLGKKGARPPAKAGPASAASDAGAPLAT